MCASYTIWERFGQFELQLENHMIKYFNCCHQLIGDLVVNNLLSEEGVEKFKRKKKHTYCWAQVHPYKT